jgi:hypothetical protein
MKNGSGNCDFEAGSARVEVTGNRSAHRTELKNRWDHRRKSLTASIQYFADRGVVLSAPRSTMRSSGKSEVRGDKRGIISGWSVGSRRRMREAMIHLAAPDGWCELGVTCTVPGPIMSAADWRLLWGRFRKGLERSGWCAVWRLELQQRGQPHLHLRLAMASKHPADVALMWLAALRGCPAVPHPVDGKLVSRSDLPGAHDYSCDVQDGGGRGSWLRYLQDHASKSKQAQLLEWVGFRHWGFVNKGVWARVEASTESHLEGRRYYRILRVLQRLATPSVPAACVFGRRLGWRPRFGIGGAAVRFMRVDTVRRVEEWATQQEGGL